LATSVDTEDHLSKKSISRAGKDSGPDGPEPAKEGPEDEGRRSLLRIAGWVLPALFLLGLLPRVYIFAMAGISRVGWPWQIDYAEGVNLNAAYLLSQGHDIYHHNGPDGFISAPYPPLFFLLTAPFQFGGPSFAVGRAISLISTVVVSLLIAYVVWKVAHNLAASLLAGALWLSLSPVIIWSAFFKQDIPAMALDLAGMVWIMRRATTTDYGRWTMDNSSLRSSTVSSPPRRQERQGSPRFLWISRFAHSIVQRPSSIVRPRDLLIASLLFTLAFYMKQSAITGAAATGIWLLVRDWRTGLHYGVTLAAMILIPFFTVNLLLQGGLWEHLVGYHSLPQTGRRFVRSMRALLDEYWPILLIGGVALLGCLALLWPRRGQPFIQEARARVGGLYGLIVLYTVLGWGQTLTKSGYEGANFNHLMDGLLPTCILVGLAAAYLGRLLVNNDTPLWGGLGWAAIGGLLVAQMFSFNLPQNWFGNFVGNNDKDHEMQGFSRLVASTPGDMFSEDAYLLLRNGKLPIYEDASTFVPLADLHEWDDSVFNQAILDRRFSFIFLLQGNVRWTEAGLKAFGESYNLKFPGSVEAYEPKLFPDVPAHALSCELTAASSTIKINGYSLPPGVVQDGIRAGQTLRVQLWWQPLSATQQSYASFIHVIDDKGGSVAGQDNPQTGATLPTTAWQPGRPITDTASIPLPATLQAGRYRLVAGMYAAQNGAIQPLKPACGADRAGQTFGDAVLFGTVEIKK
jgi:hypothetical protein